MTHGVHGLVVGGLLHDLAVDLVPDGFKLSAIDKDGVDTVDFVLVLQQRHVSHISGIDAKTDL